MLGGRCDEIGGGRFAVLSAVNAIDMSGQRSLRGGVEDVGLDDQKGFNRGRIDWLHWQEKEFVRVAEWLVEAIGELLGEGVQWPVTAVRHDQRYKGRKDASHT
jgi:hypothetical protein